MSPVYPRALRRPDGKAMSVLRQTSRVLRCTLFLLLAVSLQVSARVDAQKVTLSLKNVELVDAFRSIEKQTKFSFVYSQEDVAAMQNISITVSGVSVEEALNILFKGLSVGYTIDGKYIVVKKRPAAKTMNPELMAAPAPPGEIRGTVLNDKGEPLEGATVQIQGTKKLTATDSKGGFVLKGITDNTATLEISNVGYGKKTAYWEGQHVMVKLEASTNELDETVIKGYYNTTKRLNTGNVTTVKGEDMQKQPETNPILALEGRVPGLYISQGDGLPGSNISVMLRGTNSIANGRDPFYIVDGVPFTSVAQTAADTGPVSLSPFNSINMADVESIEVLKDADATAIYGSRGANGVILITTKKGKAGKTRFDGTVATGINRLSRKIELLNTQQYLSMRHEAFNNDGAIAGITDYDVNGVWDTTRYTDWQKTFLENPSHYTNGQMNISGGDAQTQFLIGGGYTYQNSYLPGSFYNKKGAAHVSFSHNSRDNKFHLTFGSSYTNNINVLPGFFSATVILFPPDAPALYDDNGKLNWMNNTWNNPLSPFLRKYSAFTDNLISNLNLRYELLPGLELKGNIGYTSIQTKQINVLPLISYSPSYASLSRLRQTQYGIQSLKTYVLEPQLQYSRFISKGHLEALFGVTYQQNSQNAFAAIGSNYTSDDLLGTLSAASTISGIKSNNTLYRYNASFIRLNYNWEDKYLINVTGRRDGSTRFGPGNQFGNFGAVGVGWIFTKEKFMRGANDLFSYGKLRASYGTTGNDQIGDFQYISTYSANSYYTYQGAAYLAANNLVNTNFHWELNKKLEGGLELGFLKDRLQASISYYRNRTGNQLVGYSLPWITGFAKVQGNLPAVIQNTGLEMTLNSSNIKNKNFTWSTAFNISIPRNKLISFPGLAGTFYASQYEIGKSLYVRKLYDYTGVDAKTGIYTFKDVNKDGQIDFTHDAQFGAQVSQSYFGGFNNSVTYKNIQLDILFQFVKQTGYNYNYNFSLPGTIYANQSPNVMNRWQNSEKTGVFQKFTQDYGSEASSAFANFQQSNAIISDASFIRCKNISLSYTLPIKILSKIHLQNLRFYCQMQNLFTITKYNGADPETQGLLPPFKTIVGGISITF